MEVSYSMTNYIEIAQSLAQQMEIPWEGNQFIIPPRLGKGMVEAYHYEEFSVSMSLFQLLPQITVRREYSPLQNFLIFDYTLAGLTDSAHTDTNENFTQLLYNFSVSTPSTISKVTHTAGGSNQQFAILVNKTWLESFLEKELPAILQNPNEPLMILSSLKKEMLGELSLLIHSKSNMKNRKQYLYGKSLTILANTLDVLYEEEREYPPSAFHPEDTNTILQVAEHITEHIEQHVTIEELSQKFNINRDKLQNLFKTIFGKTIADYARLVRMNKALSELKLGKTVSEVGYQMGYSNLSHFSKAFRKVHGFNPSEVNKVKLS